MDSIKPYDWKAKGDFLADGKSFLVEWVRMLPETPREFVIQTSSGANVEWKTDGN